jgi:hypothetical protein
MNPPPTQSAGDSRFTAVQPPSDFQSHRFDLALQLCLLWLLAASVWCLLGPEPLTAFTHRLQLSLVGLAACLSAGFLIADIQAPSLIKWGAISACLVVTVAGSVQAARNYDAGAQILIPARVQQGRIVHHGIGLSYALPPSFQVNLEPTISLSRSRRAHSSKSPDRLRPGEVAVLCQMVESTSSKESSHGPAWIMLEVQKGTIANLSMLIREVRREQEKWAAMPGFQIVRTTHVSRIAGLDLVEFEFIKEPQHLSARQVYLWTGTWVLHFLLNTEVEGDRRRFDDFLNSIRVGTAE